MWNVIISWTTTIISTIQILCYKYYPSPLAQRQMLVEDEQENRQDGRERSEKVTSTPTIIIIKMK